MYDHLSDQELIEAAKATRALGITNLAEALDRACALRCLSLIDHPEIVKYLEYRIEADQIV